MDEEFKNFVRLVKMTRQSQAHYFSFKTAGALKTAKDMEKRLDAEVLRIEAIFYGEPKK